MSQRSLHTSRRRWFALPVRISMGLVGAAFIPLFIMLIYTYVQTRPALVDQANKAMSSDAQTRVQLIDTYFNERVADALTLVQVPSVQYFLQLPPAPTSVEYQSAQEHASYSLLAGLVRDPNYRNWTLFDSKGNLLINAPLKVEPQKHGQTYVPPDYLDRLNVGQSFISPVYGSRDGNSATVDIYAPVRALVTKDTPKPPVIGFMRSTLKLDYIWNKIVQKDLGSNGAGSYAFILDENGIRIADTDQARRFTSVTPLSNETAEEARQQERFGTAQAVELQADQGATDSIQRSGASDTFQSEPAGQHEQFQVVRQSTSTPYIVWHYFVLSPVTTVTAVADQALISIFLVAVLASLVVALVGWFVGRGMAQPILRAVGNLRESSTALSTLATNQQEAASEQVWVVDSSQVGVQSVQYYTDAAQVALHQLQDIVKTLAQNWRQVDPQRIDAALDQALKAIHYLDNAMKYQDISNQKLATALKVATQVTEQLHYGATSATEAAGQLEDVVQRLLAVAGSQ